MSCPLCGEVQDCAHMSAPVSSALTDPEAWDALDQQFEASLEAAEAAEDEPVAARTFASSQTLSSPPLPPWSGIARHAAEESAPAPCRGYNERPHDDRWRDEVLRRVQQHKARRRRHDPSSLLLDFEGAAAPRLMEPAASAMRDEADADLEPDWPFLSSPPPRYSPMTVESPNKVIEFPRPAPEMEELAEPVMETPRILEAPEEMQAELPLETIRLDDAPAYEPQPVEFELPVSPAPLAARFCAEAMDMGLVLGAVAVFAAVVMLQSGWLPLERSTLALGAVSAVVFWGVFQWIFLMHARATPGMESTGLRLCRFDGSPAGRTERARRALASVLSLVSIGLGFAWTLLDEDRLSWHDRISGTYLE